MGQRDLTTTEKVLILGSIGTGFLVVGVTYGGGKVVAKVIGKADNLAGATSLVDNVAPNSGKLVFDAGSNTWKSPAGLIYGQGSKQGNRVKHVLEHLVPDPSKAKHSIFNVDRTKVIGLIDEGWSKRGAHVVGDPGAYVVDMGRVIGTAGETHLRIIVRPGTTEVISAYPWIP
jgi:filamentous hemagglutinin